MFRICFDLFVLNFRNVRLKSVNFKWIVSFFTFLSRPYHLEITIMVRVKNLKKTMISIMHLYHALTKACQKFDTFCEIWVLTPSFFDTPLRQQYPIFSPKIKQVNWLTYCSMKIQNYLCDKLGLFFFWTFFTPNIPFFLWTVYLKCRHHFAKRKCVFS